MTISQLHSEICKFITNNFEEDLRNNPIFDIPYIAKEIIARLFILSFSRPKPSIDAEMQKKHGNMDIDEDLLVSTVDKEKSFAFDNINSYNAKHHGNRDDTLGLLRRRNKKYMIVHENKIKYYSPKNAEYYTFKMENNRLGRSLDMANLYFMDEDGCDSTYDLLMLVFGDRICDSKKASDNSVAEAYVKFDAAYKKAKELSKSDKYEDKLEYIFRWVNFHRLETEYQLSIIPQIADAIISTNHTQERKWSYNDLIRIFGGYSNNGICFFAYQILTNYDNIELMFSPESKCDVSAIKESNYCMRCIETQTVSYFNNHYSDAFNSFFEGSVTAVDDLFHFCVNIYPIIEKHQNSNLYITPKKLNKPKIKQVRKIVKALIDTEKLKTQFKKVP